MRENLSQEEINEILMNKSLDELYIAILQKKNTDYTPQELFAFLENVQKDPKLFKELIHVMDLIDEFEEKTGEPLSEENKQQLVFASLQYLLDNSNIRHTTVLTIVDNKIFDIAENDFFDLGAHKIVAYDSVSEFYNEDNARMERINDPFFGTIVTLNLEDRELLKYYLELNNDISKETDETYNFILETLGKSKRK